MIIEHPEWWIRAHAVNMSIYNPDYLDAKMAWDDTLMATIKSRVELTGDMCMTDCGTVPQELQFNNKY